MQPGYICVAGIDPKSGHHVRPVLAGQRLGTGLLVKAGGPFDMGAVVDLGEVQHQSNPPETEDHLFVPANASFVRDLSADRFWQMLSDNAASHLRSIFGGALQSLGKGAVVNLNAGEASLGCVRLKTPPKFEINGWDKIRAHLNDRDFTLDLSVTDLRLYRDDQKTPRSKLLLEIGKRIARGVPVILAVGLARAWHKPGDDRRRHWLQVNNIHLEDDPVWKLA
jgi:hypothetical protein